MRVRWPWFVEKNALSLHRKVFTPDLSVREVLFQLENFKLDNQLTFDCSK